MSCVSKIKPLMQEEADRLAALIERRALIGGHRTSLGALETKPKCMADLRAKDAAAGFIKWLRSDFVEDVAATGAKKVNVRAVFSEPDELFVHFVAEPVEQVA